MIFVNCATFSLSELFSPDNFYFSFAKDYFSSSNYFFDCYSLVTDVVDSVWRLLIVLFCYLSCSSSLPLFYTSSWFFLLSCSIYCSYSSVLWASSMVLVLSLTKVSFSTVMNWRSSSDLLNWLESFLYFSKYSPMLEGISRFLLLSPD